MTLQGSKVEGTDVHSNTGLVLQCWITIKPGKQFSETKAFSSKDTAELLNLPASFRF